MKKSRWLQSFNAMMAALALVTVASCGGLEAGNPANDEDAASTDALGTTSSLDSDASAHLGNGSSDAATGAVDATLALDGTLPEDASPTDSSTTASDALVPSDAPVADDGMAAADVAAPKDATLLEEASASDDASIATEAGAVAPTDAGLLFDADGVATIPPPWEIDGAIPDAGCAGKMLDSGACLVALALGQANPLGIALDETSVYWCNQGSGPVLPSIAKVGRFGGMPVTLAAGGVGSPYDLAVDNTNVYWSGDAIRSVGVNGGAMTTLFDDYNSVTRSVTRAGTRVYWLDTEADYGVRSVFVDGTSFVDVTAGELEIGAVAATTPGFVYTVDSDTEGVSSLVVAESLDGGATTTSLPPAAADLVRSAYGVIVFTGLNPTTGIQTISWLPLGGGTPTVLASGVYPTDLITDGTYVYWTDGNLHAIVKLDIATATTQVLASSADDARIGGGDMLTIDSTSIYFTAYGGCEADGGGCAGAVLKLTPR